MTDWLLALSLALFLVLGGYQTGKWQERRDWKKQVPAAMNQLCIECERTGEEVVLEKIEAERIQTN